MKLKASRKPLPLALVGKPMARAVRVTLFEREVKERLSAAAVEILFGRAQVLAEGRRAKSATAGQAFFGSIMLTFDLSDLSAEVRERCDASTAGRLAAMMGADARVLRRVRQIAEREGTRLAGVPIRAHSADVRVRAEGSRVFVDVDVEESLGLPCAERRGRGAGSLV